MISNLLFGEVLPVNAVMIENETLDCFLQTIDIDERDDEDGAGAMCKFKDSWMISIVRLR